MTSYTTKTKTAVKTKTAIKTKAKNGKKQCKLGKSCKYQHEYQHQLEFDHDNEAPEKEKTSFQGKGQKLGTNSGSSSRNDNFSSRGYRLGGGDSQVDSIQAPSVTVMRPTQGKLNNNRSVTTQPRKVDSTVEIAVDNHDNSVWCEVCKKTILITDVDRHSGLHESERSDRSSKRKYPDIENATTNAVSSTKSHKKIIDLTED